MQVQLAVMAAAFVIAVIVWHHYHGKAIARDHVAEVRRPVKIPLLCANCAFYDAPFKFPARRFVINWRGDIPMEEFPFRFCLQCSRIIRRRQQLGFIIALAGAFTILLLPLSIFAIISSKFVVRLANIGHNDWFLWLLVSEVIVGPFMILGGITVDRMAAPVNMIDTESQTIVFSFRTQAYRDDFASLNGGI